ncbi:hypothetical protein LX36DRAFT_290414 [Colletotrichum falcatum]|nr:hypothetical protein LX36DRAFT_290414 [Colletotrichum falcatum]
MNSPLPPMTNLRILRLCSDDAGVESALHLAVTQPLDKRQEKSKKKNRGKEQAQSRARMMNSYASGRRNKRTSGGGPSPPSRRPSRRSCGEGSTGTELTTFFFYYIVHAFVHIPRNLVRLGPDGHLIPKGDDRGEGSYRVPFPSHPAARGRRRHRSASSGKQKCGVRRTRVCHHDGRFVMSGFCVRNFVRIARLSLPLSLSISRFQAILDITQRSSQTKKCARVVVSRSSLNKCSSSSGRLSSTSTQTPLLFPFSPSILKTPVGNEEKNNQSAKALPCLA